VAQIANFDIDGFQLDLVELVCAARCFSVNIFVDHRALVWLSRRGLLCFCVSSLSSGLHTLSGEVCSEVLGNRLWNIKGQRFPELDQFGDENGLFTVSPAHHHVVELFVVRQRLPLLADDLVALLPFEFWSLCLQLGHHFSTEKSVSAHKPKLSRRLDGLVVAAEPNSVDFSPQIADFFFARFKVLIVASASSFGFAFKSSSLLLGRLVLPAAVDDLRNFTLLQVRHLVAYLVELLVEERLEGVQRQLWLLLLGDENLPFEFVNSANLIIRQITKVCIRLSRRPLEGWGLLVLLPRTLTLEVLTFGFLVLSSLLLNSASVVVSVVPGDEVLLKLVSYLVIVAEVKEGGRLVTLTGG